MRTPEQPGSGESSPKPSVVYLAQDCTDSAVAKRAHGFQAIGLRVTSFSFRRVRFNREYQPDWTNVELGMLQDASLFKRVLGGLRALWPMVRNREAFRSASLVYARNLDLALLAMFALFVSRSRAPLIYEVLDVHRSLLGPGIPSRILRALERVVLARSAMLVVSSPEFLNRYFLPVQGFRGEHFVLENKIFESEGLGPRRTPTAEGPPWVIVWTGTLRCRKSLRVLTGAAAGLGNRVEIRMHGFPSRIGIREFMDVVETCPQMSYLGEYQAPEDLRQVYEGAHFNWCADFAQEGGNSDWLLPNRIYEGGYFGIPALGIQGQYSGMVIEEEGLGVSIDGEGEEGLISFLGQLGPQEYHALRRRSESHPVSRFVDRGDLDVLIQRVLGRGEGAR